MSETQLSLFLRIREIAFASTVWLSALSVFGAFIWLLSDIVSQGLPGLSWSYLTTSPQASGREGGIAPILVSTFLLLIVCMSVTLPLGLGTAVLLAEYARSDRWFSRFVRRSLDVLAGTPSIVFGLFGNVLFSKILGLGFSILSGGLTLACMVLPILIRTTEEGFRMIPDYYRDGATALGISRTSTLTQLLIPAALPSLLVGFVLGVGRALAETAALLFTSGYVDRMPSTLFDSGRSLSVHIYDLSMHVAGGEPNAYTSALVLIAILLIINVVANLLSVAYAKGRTTS